MGQNNIIIDYMSLKKKINTCNSCGGDIVWIRGKVGSMKKRAVCATCVTEMLEAERLQQELNNQIPSQNPNVA